ncbi:hypothetical protein JM654_04675 [Microbacterium oxydans]|nr:hypothetical protein [Microbacterium oxydans]
MRGAIVAYMRNVGMTNLSKFANEAIMEKVERLEAQYNGGGAVRACRPGRAHRRSTDGGVTWFLALQQP